MIKWLERIYNKLFIKEEIKEEIYGINNLIEDYNKYKKIELIEYMEHGIDPIPDDTWFDGLELINYSLEDNIKRIRYKAYIKHRYNKKSLNNKLIELKLDI